MTRRFLDSATPAICCAAGGYGDVYRIAWPFLDEEKDVFDVSNTLRDRFWRSATLEAAEKMAEVRDACGVRLLRAYH